EVIHTLEPEGLSQAFVATIAEGQVLRQKFPDLELFVFEGLPPSNDEAVQVCRNERLVPVLNSTEQVARWRSDGQGAPCAVHVDTAMSRLGFDWRTFRAADVAGVEPSLLLTHFACADVPGSPLNALQVERFRAVSQLLPEVPVSMGNCAAGLSDQIPTRGVLRAGIGLYGGNPYAMQPSPVVEVACLEAEVLQCRRLNAGDSAGYGATWHASGPCEVATVGIGYADGVPRSLSNRGALFVGGQRCPIVGRVSMDAVQIDVTGRSVAAGDWIEVFGGDYSIDAFAGDQDTIAYEVLTRLGPRIVREYVD
ncbi:MAG: alanine racemase, partial [Pseudomonadota bacterium]